MGRLGLRFSGWQISGVCLLMWTQLVHAQQMVPVRGVVISLIDDIDVASEDLGLLREVHVHPGDQVVAGQLLAQLSDDDAKLTLTRAEAELKIAMTAAKNDLAVQLTRKNLGVASAELQRAEETNKKYPGTVSATEVDRLRLAMERAELEIQQAEQDMVQKTLQVELRQAERDLARRQVERRKIIAPGPGLVTRVDLQAGEWMPLGSPLCRIVNLNRVRAQGFVSGALPQQLIGQPVELVVMRGGERIVLPGVVTFIDPEVNSVNGQSRIWAEIENEEGVLRAGEPAELLIPLPEAEKS